MPNIASVLSLPSHDCSGDRDGPVDGDQTESEILVPALEELELYRITFSRADSGSDLNTLREAISTRRGTRCSLAIKKSVVKTNGRFEPLELVERWEG